MTALDALTANTTDLTTKQREVRLLVDERRDLVTLARSEGASWRQIEDATGVLRQSLIKGARS